MTPDFTLPNGAEVFKTLEQGSEDWHRVRLGLLTASEASILFVKGKRPDGLGAGAITAAHRVVGELITGALPEAWSNVYTERGHALEEEWRGEYAFITDAPIEQVGFIRLGDKRFGGSPDALVGTVGGWECKSHKPETLIPMLLDEGFPDTHKPQCLANMLASDREWWDLTAGFPGMLRLERRLYREQCRDDEKAFWERLDAWNAYVEDVIERLRRGSDVPFSLAAE